MDKWMDAFKSKFSIAIGKNLPFCLLPHLLIDEKLSRNFYLEVHEM
jgi:hypothetical protein